jgi:hypothetical protein
VALVDGEVDENGHALGLPQQPGDRGAVRSCESERAKRAQPLHDVPFQNGKTTRVIDA